MNIVWPALLGLSISALLVYSGFQVGVARAGRSLDAACLDSCAQSGQVCNAVAERMGITVTIPPWQAMVLTPILDPR